MAPDEKIVAQICRIEYEKSSGKLYMVFEVIDPKLKQDVKENWTKDIEFKIVDKNLANKF